MKMIILLGIILLGFPSTVQAQTSSTANFTASVTIIQPIIITNTGNMNFGSIDAQQGGKVILTPENTRVSNGHVALAGEENLSAASFQVKGQAGMAYSLQVPTASYTLSNGTEEIIIEDFTSSLGAGGLLADGTQTFNIGATLNVKPGQTPGFYTNFLWMLLLSIIRIKCFIQYRT